MSSDGRAVRRVLSGHPEAFESLVLRHQQKAHAVAHALGVPRSALEDVAQEAFLQAFRDLASLEEPSRFGAWFLQIVRHTARRFMRRSRDARRAALSDGAEARPQPTAEDEDFAAYLRRKIDALSPELREAIFIYYYEAGAVSEVARALGISRAAAKKRLQRGRDLLRRELWLELEETLRDLLPSTRERQRRTRHLALLAMASIPLALRARAGTAAPATAGGTLVASGAATAVVAKGKATLLALALLATLLGASTVALLRGREQGVAVRGAAAGVAPSGTVPSDTVPSDTVRHAPGEATAAFPAAGPPPAAAIPAARLRIEDAAGAPIEGARVALAWQASTGEGRSSIVPVAEPLVSSLQGEAQIRKRLGDIAVFTVGARGFAPRLERLPVPLDGIREPFVIALEHGPELSCRIVESDGEEPLPGARVSLLGPDLASPLLNERRIVSLPPSGMDAGARVNLLHDEVADSEGRASVTGLPGVVWVTAEGRGPTAVRVGGGSLGGIRAELVIPVFPPTTLRLIVRREDGDRVDRFVYAIAEALEALPASVTGRNAEGSEAAAAIYHLCDVRGGRAVPLEEIAIAVRSEDREVRRTLKLELGRENRVEISLPAAAWLTGRVVGPGGAPVAGAGVVLADPAHRALVGDAPRAAPSSRTSTDKGGRYRIPLAGRAPPFAVIVEATDHATHLGDPFLAPRHRDVRHDVQLAAGARILLSTAGATGSPVRVDLESPSSEAFPLVSFRRSVELGSSGRGELARVPAGVWALTWSRVKERISGRYHVAVVGDRTYEVHLGETPPGEATAVLGSLAARGRPLAGREVWLVSAGALLGRSTSDDLGRFVLPAVPAGSYGLALPPPRDGPRAPMPWLPVRIAVEPEPLTIDLTPTALSGRVTARGEPLRGALVTACARSSADAESAWRPYLSAETDASGEFRLPSLHQVPFVLVARKQGHAMRELEWEPRGEVEAMLPELRLEPLEGRGGLTFRVAAANGGDVGAVTVEVCSLARPETLLLATASRSRPEERLEIAGLPSGRHRVLVLPRALGLSEHATAAFELEHQALGAPREIPVLLQPGGSVLVRLVSDDGRLPPHADIEVLDAAGAPLPLPGGATRLRFHGQTTLHGLPAVRLTARLLVPGAAPVEVELVVEPGRLVKIEHRLGGSSEL